MEQTILSDTPAATNPDIKVFRAQSELTFYLFINKNVWLILKQNNISSFSTILFK